MRGICAIGAALLLAGCTTTKIVTVPVPEMVPIPPDFLTCPGVKYPNPDALTDKQVARLLIKLDTALRSCRGNNAAIRKLQEEFKKEAAARRAAAEGKTTPSSPEPTARAGAASSGGS